MITRVIYPKSQEGQLSHSYTYETHQGKQAEALEEIFRQFNHVDGTEEISIKGYKERSLSVGDVVHFPYQFPHCDGSEWYVCDIFGWKQVSSEFIMLYMELTTFSDRIMGIDSCVKEFPQLKSLLG